MLGLGVSLTSATVAESSQGARMPSNTDWTVTTLGAITTPQASLFGTLRSTQVTVYIDNANDWTGTLGDYDIESLVINNVTSAATSNQGNLKFNVDGGSVLTLHSISKTGFNLESLVSGSSGDTIRFTFNLALDGYNDVELVAEKTY